MVTLSKGYGLDEMWRQARILSGPSPDLSRAGAGAPQVRLCLPYSPSLPNLNHAESSQGGSICGIKLGRGECAMGAASVTSPGEPGSSRAGRSLRGGCPMKGRSAGWAGTGKEDCCGRAPG